MGDAYNPDPYQPPPPVGDLPPDARQMAMLAHLLGALFGFIGPLIIYLTQKDKHPFVADQGKEAVNFTSFCSSAIRSHRSCGAS